MSTWLTWLIIAGLMFVLEIITTGFLVFWFAIAALLTMILSFFVDIIAVQIVFFVVMSILLILLTKPLVNKFISKGPVPPTNVYTIIGKKAVVTTEINNAKGIGQIKIDSDIWSAKSENDEVIPIDSIIEIIKVEGVKVIVKKI